MAFCAKCGAQVAAGATFCQQCGTAVAATPTSGAAAPPPAASQTVASTSGMTSNVAGLLCYLPFVGWIVSIIFLMIEPQKNDRFVRFHAFQAIFLAVIAYLLWWATGYALSYALYGLLRLAIFILQIFMMFKAYNNERFKLPVIGDLAEKQASAPVA